MTHYREEFCVQGYTCFNENRNKKARPYIEIEVGDRLVFTPEASNKFDPNARLVECGRYELGHVPKEMTNKFRNKRILEAKIVSLYGRKRIIVSIDVIY